MRKRNDEEILKHHFLELEGEFPLTSSLKGHSRLIYNCIDTRLQFGKGEVVRHLRNVPVVAGVQVWVHKRLEVTAC